MRRRWHGCAVFALWLVACSYDMHKLPDSCVDNGDCTVGTRCYRSFCVVDALVKGPGSSDTTAGTPCDSNDDPMLCYDGSAETQDVGACRAGMRFCARGTYTGCLDQVTPAIETCNSVDDDCNGAIDDIAGQSCDVSSAGGCGAAGTIVCRDGAPSCELSQLAGIEACNGEDDDCDGRTDENLPTTCYPEGATGCVQDGNGVFTCQGVCGTGALTCADAIELCAGATTAAMETCGGDPALDEDCDGSVDENCPCTDGSSQHCYGGPPSGVADNSGACGPGTQSCKSGVMGACMSQSLPVPEDCANSGHDDDCNGIMDDVKELGTPCSDETKMGECRTGTLQCRAGTAAPVCVGAEPTTEACDAVDQDCDGNPVNGFDLNSTQRCGSCDVRCAPFQTCCDGKCVYPITFLSDPANCGGCGIACGSYQFCCEGRCYNPSWSSFNQAPDDAMCCDHDCGSKSCCGRECVDLQNDDYNCGSCGHECPSDLWCVDGQCGQQ